MVHTNEYSCEMSTIAKKGRPTSLKVKALLHCQTYFLNVAAVIAVVIPSIIAQGKKTVVGLSEKGRDRYMIQGKSSRGITARLAR